MRARAALLAVLAVVAMALALSGCAAHPPTVTAPLPQRPVAAPTPAAAPPPAPAVAPTAPARVAAPAQLVRILLAQDAVVTLSEPGRRWACSSERGALLLRGPIVASATGGRPALQVGAFSAESRAWELARRLQGLGFPAEVAAGKLVSVVALGAAGETPAALGARLAAAGFNEQMARGVRGAELTLHGEDGRSVAGGWVRLHPVDDVPVAAGGVHVRGDIVLRSGADGVLLINQLDVEQYLRGVVPAEMGPRAFPALEALKAQAVAARTYAMAHLGDHEADGYDLCATVQCQVYRGVDVEDPLSDRAVAETGGEVLVWHGRLVDARYHSTCGGHTEDASVSFPGLDAPYLRGVACRHVTALEIGRQEPPGPWLGDSGRLALVARRIATRLGAATQPAALAAALGLGDGSGGSAAAAVSRELAPLLRLPPERASAADVLRTARVAPPSRGGDTDEQELATVVRLAQALGVVQEVRGTVVPNGAAVRFVTGSGSNQAELTGDELVLERRGLEVREAMVHAGPGSPATAWFLRGRCELIEVEGREEADAGSSWSWWTRRLTWEEISSRLGIAGVSGIEVLTRGVSGRAATVSVDALGGSRKMTGAELRLELGLPDTLFVVRRDGEAAVFTGRGWGHGVGMCQNGAYGLAVGGATYEQILKTYYTGVELRRQ